MLFVSTGSASWIVVSQNNTASTPDGISQHPSASVTPTITQLPYSIFVKETFTPVISSSPVLQNTKTVVITTAPVKSTKVITTTAVPQATRTNTPIPTFSPTFSPTSIPTYTYKDGTYSVTGSYNTPGGPQSIKIQVTISADNISAIAVTNLATDPESYNYEEYFKSGIAAKVVGKPLNNATSISTVNGASLTTNYFKYTAVSNIKTQAQ